MKTIRENPWYRCIAICFLSFSILLTTGCNGCRNSAEDETAKKEEEEKKKKKKPDFETNTPILLPAHYPEPKKSREELEKETKEGRMKREQLERLAASKNRTKLGHWYTANFQAIANNYNTEGELSAYSMNAGSRPIPIPDTNYYVRTTRPTSLPKGEWKNFETSVFVPTRDINAGMVNVNYEMRRRSSGTTQIMFGQPTQVMKSFQNHIVLLSDRADVYAFLSSSNFVKLSGLTSMAATIPPFYYIVPTQPDDPIPLSRNGLNWTTIAYVIWDDLDPAKLDEDHQKALLDWLHFGGQLIVSGPDCLDKLQNSFLGEYLPAQFDGSINLTDQDIKELNDNWSVPFKFDKDRKRILQISQKIPLLGVQFKPHESAQFIDGTGELAIERRVGRGRIVATAVSLTAPSFRAWGSYDSFFNGALLRKPARNFGKTSEFSTSFEFVGDGTSCFDPMMNTTLRYIARDLSPNGQLPRCEIKIDEDANSSVLINPDQYTGSPTDLGRNYTLNADRKRNLKDQFHYGGFEEDSQAGLSGWNDNSGVAVAARETLKEAAGISPPSSAFVLKMLAAYLVVLVPLNWILFRLIGKVEYAWIAAPIIAIAGAFYVVRMASLDIGFVRSNTQVGILEIQPGYDRGHLAEYSALYTSLSTRYNAQLDNLSAQSLPFGVVGPAETFSPGESLSPVTMKRTTENNLDGFQIQSNSTGLLHSEFMLNLGGTIRLTGTDDEAMSVKNSTGIDVQKAGVIRRNSEGQYQVAWVGDLISNDSAELKFKSASPDDPSPWETFPEFQNNSRVSQRIWDANFEGVPLAAPEQLQQIPELQEQWPRYEEIIARIIRDRESGTISPGEFDRVYQIVNNVNSVSLGRMLDKVLANLTLGPNEYRLIGVTDRKLGTSKFEPASTQTDQQTLIVAHLKYSKLQKAERDVNAFEDFKQNSTLTREANESGENK